METAKCGSKFGHLNRIDDSVESGGNKLSSSSEIVCCVHFHTNAIRHSMNTFLLPSAMGLNSRIY